MTLGAVVSACYPLLRTFYPLSDGPPLVTTGSTYGRLSDSAHFVSLSPVQGAFLAIAHQRAIFHRSEPTFARLRTI